MMNLNMSEAFQQAEQDQVGFKVLPVGDYPVLIDNVEYKQFNSGNWGVNIRLEVLPTVTEFAGVKIFDRFIMFEADGVTEKTSPDKNTGMPKNYGKLNYAKICQAVGLTPEQAGEPMNLQGKMVTVKTKMGESQSGDKEHQASYYKPMPVGGGTQAPATAPAQTAPAQSNGFGQTQPAQQAQPTQSGNAFAR